MNKSPRTLKKSDFPDPGIKSVAMNWKPPDLGRESREGGAVRVAQLKKGGDVQKSCFCEKENTLPFLLGLQWIFLFLWKCYFWFFFFFFLMPFLRFCIKRNLIEIVPMSICLSGCRSVILALLSNGRPYCHEIWWECGVPEPLYIQWVGWFCG